MISLQSDNLIKMLAKEFLGKDWRIVINQEASLYRNYHCFLDYKITFNGDELRDAGQLGPYLRDSVETAIKDTEIFRRAQNDWDKEIKAGVDHLVDLREEIERLRKFETYFNMSYDMAHGAQRGEQNE